MNEAITMSESATLAAPARTIRFEYHLPNAPEQVWRALSEPELLAKWLMPSDIRAEPGHRFRFQAPPMPHWDGIVYCEVLEAEPVRRLVYSWCGGAPKAADGGYELDTVVSWTLEPEADGGTHLILEHSGFESDGFAFQAISKGWAEKGVSIERALASAA